MKIDMYDYPVNYNLLSFEMFFSYFLENHVATWNQHDSSLQVILACL